MLLQSWRKEFIRRVDQPLGFSRSENACHVGLSTLAWPQNAAHRSHVICPIVPHPETNGRTRNPEKNVEFSRAWSLKGPEHRPLWNMTE